MRTHVHQELVVANTILTDDTDSGNSKTLSKAWLYWLRRPGRTYCYDAAVSGGQKKMDERTALFGFVGSY